MAAQPSQYGESIRQEPMIDLRELAAGHLEPLLEEETEAWRSSLDWDFRPSADLVRRFINLRSLNGFALVSGGAIDGYSYYVAEEGKGLIGDFYVRPAARTAERENRLLQTVLDAMWRTPGLRRIEAQLMMLGRELRPAPYGRWFQSYRRQFLELPLNLVRSFRVRDPEDVAFAPWTESWRDETARLIAATYRGHVDSQINDQYRSPAGAHRFLVNIVQYLGCGAFFAPASFVAWDRGPREMCGVSLASMVAPEVGHITQVCVAPTHQGKGIGYELLRRSLTAFAAQGCRSISLTVTSANESALRVYQQMGFRKRRDFEAYVWDMGG
jgi:ribosomal protein S18 acetylase RimI-like enzyme